MSFGRTLQDLRAKAGLSQAQLAAKAGIPVKTIQAWEISRRTPRWIGMLFRLARGLGVSMEELAAGADEETAPESQGRRARAPARRPGESREMKKPLPRPRKGK